MEIERKFLIRQLPEHLEPVSYTHLRAHETDSYLVCRLLLEKKKTYALLCLKKKRRQADITNRVCCLAKQLIYTQPTAQA